MLAQEASLQGVDKAKGVDTSVDAADTSVRATKQRDHNSWLVNELLTQDTLGEACMIR